MPHEDYDLIDENLKGVAFSVIAEQLKYPESQCRERLIFHTDREAGGILLPVEWEVDDDSVATIETLTDDEYEALALFKWKGRGLVTLIAGDEGDGAPKSVFRDTMTAVTLRKCIAEMDEMDPGLFRSAVRVFRRRAAERRAHSRRRKRAEKAVH